MLELRRATLDDVPQLAEMRWDFRVEGASRPPPVDKEPFLLECQAFLHAGFVSGTWTCWLAWMDGQIVSHIFVQCVTKIPKPAKIQDRFGYLSNVYTRPGYRCRGIGLALLERVKTWARDADYEFLLVWPSDASQRFYERAGFACENECLACQLRPYVP